MKCILILMFLFLVLSSGYSQSKDTFQVYFPFNNARITKEAEAGIDRLIFNDTLIHGDKLIVLGYADYVGGAGYNDSLSKIRAANVRDYLVKAGFDKKDITLCIGKGKIERQQQKGNEGYAADRKVQIIIDHSLPVATIPTPPVKPHIVPAKKVIAPPPPKPKIAEPPKKEITPEIDIASLKVNQAFALNNIHFIGGSPEFLKQAQPDLELLYDFMHENPTVTIRIEGHVCCVGPNPGSDTYYSDGTLSQYRAMAVARYLTEKGIDKKRMQCAGLGNINPIVPEEKTEEDMAKNRRVEIRILSK